MLSDEDKRKRQLDYVKKWQKKNPEYWKKYQTPEVVRKRALKHKYGISPEDVSALLEKQEYKCAICKCHLTTGRTASGLRVDHCHRTKKVRGLLCHGCNVGLGHFKENPAFLAEAIVYISQHS